MQKISEHGGGVIYQGFRSEDKVRVTRTEIGEADMKGLPVCNLKTVELDPRPSQSLYNHSPDGFEWGYSGSGAAQLALALLLDAVGNGELALKYHQDFKERFVASWQKAYWAINRAQVRAFVEMKQKSDEVQEYLRSLDHE